MTRIITRLESGIAHNYFDTRDIAPRQQLQTWRERVGYLVDTPPSLEQVARGFHGSVNLYAVNDLVFLNSRTDALKLERSVARISTDSVGSYVFHIVLGGGIGNVGGLYRKQDAARCGLGILALDMSQPFHMNRPECYIFNLIAPRALVESALPNAESIHGRIIQDQSPLFRLVYDHLIAIDRELPGMMLAEADAALRVAIQLIVAAFGKQAKLTGSARAAARAAMFGQVRRYIEAHLHDPTLSAESLLNNLRLPRTTTYRLFEHEGGLQAYIRNCRLRAAADELARYPHVPVIDIAYGLGFKSHADFTRAFRRIFDMTPSDMRMGLFESDHSTTQHGNT